MKRFKNNNNKYRENNPFKSVGFKQSLSNVTKLGEMEDKLDTTFGFKLFDKGPERIGFLINMQPVKTMKSFYKRFSLTLLFPYFKKNKTVMTDEETNISKSGVKFYFLGRDGKGFKCVKTFEPYFYIQVKEAHFTEMETYLRNKYRTLITKIEAVEKEDLDLVTFTF